MNTIEMTESGFKKEKHTVDFCIVGGGMAGVCAALAAARNGVRTLLIQDRPVLGGNASSEIRMWICGALGADNKESGLLEEIMLRNLYYNSEMKYPVWDHVLYGICREEPLLELLLNCSVTGVETEGRRLIRIHAWHLTRQLCVEVNARYFADCSGDSVLRMCGASVRRGRESRKEFGESHAPLEADHKTMGNSILLQLRETDEHHPFVSPPWARKFTEAELENRKPYPDSRYQNFWWLEIGGTLHTIDDADRIRDENLSIAYGAWDLIKNHPDGRGHRWELDWIGSLPGKRENIRYVGDHILTQSEVEAEGRFEDRVAHGGWSMDDHHPEAINYPGEPTIFHPAPSPYGIPYRCLYSKDMDNLFFAGRNISATHMALSSTRVMGTTAVLGQAVGTAVAIAVQFGLTARGVYEQRIADLQKKLLDQDQYIPWMIRDTQALQTGGTLDAGELSAQTLLNGIERTLGSEDNGCWISSGKVLTWSFPTPRKVNSVRLVFDSDFQRRKRMPAKYPLKGNREEMPGMLLQCGIVEFILGSGDRMPIKIENNFKRLLTIPAPDEAVSQVIFTPLSAWGGGKVHLFSFDVK